MHDDDLIVSISDEPLSRGPRHMRTLSEFKPTNMPLSAFEIEQDEAKDTAHRGWAPRSTENIGDLTPLPEGPAIP
jgi:hypothetical protein